MLVNTKPRKYGLSHNILWSRRLCIKFFRAILKIRIHKSFIRDQWYHWVTYTHRWISEVLRRWRDQSLGLLCRLLAPTATHRFHNIVQIGSGPGNLCVGFKFKTQSRKFTKHLAARDVQRQSINPKHHGSRKPLLLQVTLLLHFCPDFEVLCEFGV